MHIFHVHFIFEKTDEYYGSIAAIYQNRTRQEIGVAYNTLRNVKWKDITTYTTGRAIIRKGEVIKSKGKMKAEFAKMVPGFHVTDPNTGETGTVVSDCDFFVE